MGLGTPVGERAQLLSLHQSTIPRVDRPHRLSKAIEDQAIVPEDCFPQEPQFWAYYAAGLGMTVTGWSSQGGIYTLDVSSQVEIEFLQLDHFKHTRRPTNSDTDWQQNENAHCDRSK